MGKREVERNGEFVEILPNHPLLDHLLDKLNYRFDSQLARLLGCRQPILSKIRRGKVKVSAAMILSIHEIIGMPVSEIRAWIAKGVKDEKGN